jgi:hypothetical protein
MTDPHRRLKLEIERLSDLEEQLRSAHHAAHRRQRGSISGEVRLLAAIEDEKRLLAEMQETGAAQ